MKYKTEKNNTEKKKIKPNVGSIRRSTKLTSLALD